VGQDVEGIEHLLEAAGRLLVTPLQAMHRADSADRAGISVAIH
jgi:hypothetical protein